MTIKGLNSLFYSLPPWSQRECFTESEWENYLSVAKVVQQSNPAIVESAFELFMQEVTQEEFKGYLSESKLFILMRVVFDLPESAPENQRRLFKGWINWPEANSDGNVNLAWPISWRNGKPMLVASYEGSEGSPYAAVQEYRYLLGCFSYRQLGD